MAWHVVVLVAATALFCAEGWLGSIVSGSFILVMLIGVFAALFNSNEAQRLRDNIEIAMHGRGEVKAGRAVDEQQTV